MNIYHLTLRATREKYLKFKKRLEKSIASGSFDQLSRRKKNMLIARVEKLRSRLEPSSSFKKGIAAAGAATLLPTIALSQMIALPPPDPKLRFEKSDFDLYQLGDNFQIEVVNLDSDPELEVLMSTSGISGRGFVQQWDGFSWQQSGPSALQDMEDEFYLGDVDGDTDIDIVFRYGSNFYLAFNDGTGDFDLTSQEYLVSSSSVPGVIGRDYTPEDVDLVDFDSDGDLDLVMANGASDLKIFKNDGSGYFETASYLSVGTAYNLREFEFGKFDGDEDMDLIFNTSGGDYDDFLVIENTAGVDADPVFGGASADLRNNTASTWRITTLDIDGDGDLDVFVHTGSNNEYLFLNQSAEGTDFLFNEPTIEGLSFSGSVTDVAVADLDGDGVDDLLLAFSGLYDDPHVAIFEDGSLVATDRNMIGDISDATRAWSTVAIGDLDGDGLNDIVGGEANSNDPYIYFDRSAPFISGILGDNIFDENLPAGDIATLLFSDFHNDDVTSSLIGDDADLFTWDSETKTLATNQAFDWEAWGSEFDLSLNLSDGFKTRTEELGFRLNNLQEKGHGLLEEEGSLLHLEENKYLENFTPADFDVDGDHDIFFAEEYMLIQNAVGFEERRINNFSSGASEVAFIDIDQDGDLDLFGKDGGTIYLLENVDRAVSSDGWDTFGTYGAGYGSFGLTAGDFDNDGQKEVALIDYSGGSYYFQTIEFYDDGRGSGLQMDQDIALEFSAGGGYMDGFGEFMDIVIADFDGDGDDDLLVITQEDGAEPGTDAIFPGTPSSGFDTSGISTLTTNADNGLNLVAVGDLNGDGSPDIAFMRSDGLEAEIDIMVNDGSGTFTSSQTLVLGGEIGTEDFDLKLGDMDGDGSLDLVATASTYSQVYTLKMWGNDGDANFSELQTIANVSGYEFELIDIDADDDLDVVIRERVPPFGEGYLNVHFNVNLPATDISLSSTSFDEHLANDTQVATISVTDANTTDVHEFTLVEGDGSNDAHNNFFAVEGTSLVITRDVSAEDYPTLNILLAANDGENIYEQALTLTVNQVNVAPSAITAPTSFDEGTAAGTSIGTLSATDDGLETVTFALATGDGSNDADNGSFIIDGDQLIITEESSFETKPSYNIYISASDIDGSVEQAFTINVNDLNQAPTAITLSTTSIEETVTAGSAIATIDADDPNAGDTHTFALVAGDGSNDVDNSKFLIEGDQLIIKQNASFETQSSYNIHLSATDSEGSVEQAFTISVNNTNELPTAITLSATSVDEEVSGGTAVATIDATDTNAGDEHDFELVAGDGSNDADNDKFLIDGDQLVIKSSPDFDAQSSYSIYLSASDSEGSVEQAFTLTVNEFVSSNNAPTGISLSSDTFDEGIAGGSAVATLTADDADAGDTHSFSFATGDGANDADNDDFLIDGDQLVIKASPSFEAQSSYNIYLSTSDGEDSFEQAFTLTVNNLNTAPTGIQISATAFDEGIAGGSSVATLTADDADAGDSHAFTLATGDGTNDADNDKFLIDGDQLVIKSSPSFETQASYNIYLSAADTEGSVEQAFTLTVNNLNSVPTGIQLSSDSFDEGIAGGSAVATLTADDADAGDSHEFTLATGDGTNDADNNRFLIDGDQLVIKSSPSFETQATYNIYLSAADSEGSVEQAFTLTVNNVNELPTAITLSAATLNEDTPAGSVVATIDATDVNASDEHVFSLVAGDGTNDVDNDKFVIKDDQLIIKQNSRFETQPSYRIYLSAADSEGSIEQAFVIDVVDINQGPNSISLSVTSLDESLAVGSTAATISATDPNAGDTQTFSLVEGDGTNDAHNDLFLINGNALILIEEIEFDDLQSININIQASDGQETLTQSFTLIINEVLGVQDELTNALGVYPNPGGSQFQINYESGLREDLILRVSDLSGRLVHEIAAAKTGDSFTYRVDMSGAKAGIYLIELITSEKIITQRWVKN